MKCTAHKTDGTPCTAWAIKGANVCRVHGGRTPQVRKAAALAVVEAKAQKALARRDVVPLADPLATLELIIAQVCAKAEWFLGELDRLIDNNDLAVVTVSQGEQLRAVALAAERWTKEARAAITDWARLGLDVKKAQHEEAVVKANLARLAEVLEGALDGAGLSGVQKADVLRRLGEGLS